MFAPIFCGQVVTGSWRGFPWRWLTIEGRVGRGGGGTLVSTVWPGQRGEAPPSVASASAVVVSVSSGAWCRLTFTDICTWTADYSHRGRSKRSEGGGGWGRWSLGLGVRECGLCFSTPLPRPSCAGLCLVLCIPVYLRFLSSTLLSTPLLTTPFHFIFFFFGCYMRLLLKNTEDNTRKKNEKLCKNFVNVKKSLCSCFGKREKVQMVWVVVLGRVGSIP